MQHPLRPLAYFVHLHLVSQDQGLARGRGRARSEYLSLTTTTHLSSSLSQDSDNVALSNTALAETSTAVAPLQPSGCDPSADTFLLSPAYDNFRLSPSFLAWYNSEIAEGVRLSLPTLAFLSLTLSATRTWTTSSCPTTGVFPVLPSPLLNLEHRLLRPPSPSPRTSTPSSTCSERPSTRLLHRSPLSYV